MAGDRYYGAVGQLESDGRRMVTPIQRAIVSLADFPKHPEAIQGGVHRRFPTGQEVSVEYV